MLHLAARCEAYLLHLDEVVAPASEQEHSCLLLRCHRGFRRPLDFQSQQWRRLPVYNDTPPSNAQQA